MNQTTPAPNTPYRLHHASGKFWEIEIRPKGTDGIHEVFYRVGKKDTVSEEVNKIYPTKAETMTTVAAKIKDKVDKGYKEPEQSAPAVEEAPQRLTRGVLKRSSSLMSGTNAPMITVSPPNAFEGQFYERKDESLRLEVAGNKVKITRIPPDGIERFQIRTFPNDKDANQFCFTEQKWYLSEGYKANKKKFKVTFTGAEEPVAPKPVGRRNSRNLDAPASKKSNTLSITKMTDDAMSSSSRNVSSAGSDRSFVSPPASRAGTSTAVTGLGKPASGCIKVLLAETWDDTVDPTGYIMSEKLDGVRCFWTGSTMYSRNGNRFFFPKFFTQNWPNCQLDGQLFIARGQFSKTLSAIKKSVPIDEEWRKVRYLVFDSPGLRAPFSSRIKALQDTFAKIDNDYIKCHAHRVCNGMTDMMEELDRVNKVQGQGLMLRDPEGYYENRRSRTLLKVKTFHDDEATILGYTEGTGRCYGMVGALKVRNSHGVEFEVGSGLTDQMRRKPPKIGTKITYKYQQFNKDSGKPRFPTFMRVFNEKI